MDKKNERLIQSIERDVYNIDKKDVKDVEKIDSMMKELHANPDISKYTGKNVLEFLGALGLAEKTNKENQSLKSLKKGSGNRKIVNELFNNKNMMSLFELERKRIERYNDYRMVDLYIPEVSYCVQMIKDAVLSPDDITKEFVGVKIDGEDLEDSKSIHAKNLNNMIKNFKLDNLMDNCTRDTCLLGDQFYAILKYKDEFEDMLQAKSDGLILRKEDTDILLEASMIDLEDENLSILAESIQTETKKKLSKTNSSKKDQVPELVDIKKALRNSVVDIVNNNFTFEQGNSVSYIKDTLQDIESYNKIQARKSYTGNASGGESFKPIKIDGAILRKLPPEGVVKLFEDGQTFGYLFTESEDRFVSNKDKNIESGVPYEDVLNQINGDFFSSKYDVDDAREVHSKRKAIVDLFADALEKKFDRKFITKNKEFKDMIYGLMKAKEISKQNVKITYFGPDEVQHFRINEKSDGYGTSKLAKSLFFAMMYISTLISELMTKIARGRDTRVIYVEVGIDNDIEQAIQDVVSDLKSKEITIDSLGSISSIMRTLSTFDDAFIPVVDGAEPIRFDTIPGNSTEVDTEFLDTLLRSIIQGMGLPHNMIDSSAEVDFSRTLVMQNDSFVRTIVAIQRELGAQYTEMFNKLYKAEYGDSFGKRENISDEMITVVFPTPQYMIMNTVNDQLQSVMTTADFITETYVDSNSVDEVDQKIKFEFKKSVVQDLVNNVDWKKYDSMFEKVKQTQYEDKLKREVKGETDMGFGGGDEFGNDSMGMEGMDTDGGLGGDDMGGF